MKPNNDFSRAFIDLARTGRTDWRAVALTLLLILFLSTLSVLGVLMFSGWSLYFEHLHIADAGKAILSGTMNPVVAIFGCWLACKFILRRPFGSLISTDLTFSIRRCLLGAALYLPANVLALAAMFLYASMRYGAWTVPLRHLAWPHGSQIVGAMAALIGMPFAVLAEELYFRGWLTQTIGQYVRAPIVVVAGVAALFAASHTQYDLPMKTLMLASSFGLSALSLRDQRLELAIGAHFMMNLCATLQTLFFTGALPHIQASAPVITFDWVILAVLKGALPFALMYWLLKRTKHGFPASDLRMAGSHEVQPGAL